MPNTKPDVLRCFVAVNLTPQVKITVGELQSRLRNTFEHRALRWVQPDLTHLTMVFLGDVDKASMEKVKAALHIACQAAPDFEISLRGLGCFPNLRRPKVLWSGVEGDLLALNTLQSRVASQLRPNMSKPDDKPFRAHLTLARVKAEDKVLSRGIEQMIANAPEGTIATWRVESVELMRSELASTGPRYFVEESVELRPL